MRTDSEKRHTSTVALVGGQDGGEELDRVGVVGHGEHAGEHRPGGVLERGIDQVTSIGEVVRQQPGGGPHASGDRAQRESVDAAVCDHLVGGRGELGAAVRSGSHPLVLSLDITPVVIYRPKRAIDTC